ncbi:hypothetical protein [Tahibacter harae]|uniref:Transposase IS200-like domain-containing protein n=1 Tax=Tahibacter harae TaxID=2963937 RepID=A0ABT1QWM2_9GAMM|nr:hypothetical protein [Tahibacter harae]MCQ4166682.1 hypothetical protein [Tahibacter harae]
MTGRDFEHRKNWIRERLHLLGECYAVAIHAYAVMSNHLHIVLQFNAAASATWSDEETASRWIRLFPPGEDSDSARELKCQALLADPERLALVRVRLGSLSWFMRCLAEPIARRANREDHCTGRFWEGRFRCQLLCDERAVLAAMAYVDLNPIRAGVVDALDATVHTSASERIDLVRHGLPPAELLRPVAGTLPVSLSIGTADYLQILDWTGRALAPGKRGRIAESAPAILAVIDRDARRWAMRVSGYSGGWARAAGCAQDLIDLAARIV